MAMSDMYGFDASNFSGPAYYEKESGGGVEPLHSPFSFGERQPWNSPLNSPHDANPYEYYPSIEAEASYGSHRRKSDHRHRRKGRSRRGEKRSGRSRSDRKSRHSDRKSHAKSSAKNSESKRKKSGNRTAKEEKELRQVYRERFVPTPTFLPEFSPYYFPPDANIEVTAQRGSGKTTLFKEIMGVRCNDFKLLLTFSSTENVQNAMEKHVPPAFNYSTMNLELIEEYLSLREQQIMLIKQTMQALERLNKQDTDRYKKMENKLRKRKDEYVCLFFDDFGDDPKNLNNKTFRRLRKNGRHYNVCLITNKQADLDTHRSERSAADVSIIFNPEDSNEVERAWQNQFKDPRLFPTLDDFKRAQQHYCAGRKGGCLVHIRNARFDHRVPSYISENYSTFAYQTKNKSPYEIGSFASHRIQLYNDAVYAPQEFLNRTAKARERTRVLEENLGNYGGGRLGVPSALKPPPPPPTDNKGSKKGSKKGAARDEEQEEPDPIDPVPTTNGRIRIQTDPTGERFWNRPLTSLKGKRKGK